MAKSVQEILGAAHMMEVINDVQRGIPRVLPDSFFKVTDRVTGDKARYFKTRGARESARQSEYGSPSRRVTQKDMAEVGITLIHSFENQALNPLTLQAIQSPASDAFQEIAIAEVDRQTVEFGQRFSNLRVSCALSALFKGAIWFDSNGNQQNSSSSAYLTIDFGTQANNENQANGIIDTTWASNTADIIGDLTALKKTQRQNGRPPLRHAFYGANISEYIASNTAAAALIAGSPRLAEQFYTTGEIPNGFCGLEWHPAYEAYLMDSSDAVASLIGDDALILTPEPNGSWWKFIEGSYMVPRSVGTIYADAVAAMNDVDLVYGTFAYGRVSHDPVTVQQYAGDTFMPVLADPNAVFVLDVTP